MNNIQFASLAFLSTTMKLKPSANTGKTGISSLVFRGYRPTRPYDQQGSSQQCIVASPHWGDPCHLMVVVVVLLALIHLVLLPRGADCSPVMYLRTTNVCRELSAQFSAPASRNFVRKTVSAFCADKCSVQMRNFSAPPPVTLPQIHLKRV